MIRSARTDPWPGTTIEQLFLDDFVFHDSRLEGHPAIRATVFWAAGDRLVLGYRVPNRTNAWASVELYELPPDSVGASTFRNQSYMFIDLEERDTRHATEFVDRWAGTSGRPVSMLVVPILAGSQSVGVLCLDFFKRDSIDERRDLGAALLLAAILAYCRGHQRYSQATPVSTALGRALAGVRRGLGLTQEQLAERMTQKSGKAQKSRIALSRWEFGAQPPSLRNLHDWCKALGLLSTQGTSIVTLVDVTPQLLSHLKADPSLMRELSPSTFESLIANRLDRMGFDVTLTGPTSRKDGGIDLIAIPKVRNVASFLVAGQVKHHSGDQKTGRDAVDRLLAWHGSDFSLGLLVTNTGFTSDATWVASQYRNRSFLRLRDLSDLRRWLQDSFSSEDEWQEIPEEVELAPNVKITIPKPRVLDPLEIWPVSRADLCDT